MQPRLAPFVHAIQIWPSITAAPDEVATIVRLGTCNPNSAKQFGQRRDSNGTKLRQTGQANARTDSIVAVRAGRRIVSAGIATEAADVATSLVKLHTADVPQEQFHPPPVPTDAARRPSRGYLTGRAAARPGVRRLGARALSTTPTHSWVARFKWLSGTSESALLKTLPRTARTGSGV